MNTAPGWTGAGGGGSWPTCRYPACNANVYVEAAGGYSSEFCAPHLQQQQFQQQQQQQYFHNLQQQQQQHFHNLQQQQYFHQEQQEGYFPNVFPQLPQMWAGAMLPRPMALGKGGANAGISQSPLAPIPEQPHIVLPKGPGGEEGSTFPVEGKVNPSAPAQADLQHSTENGGRTTRHAESAATATDTTTKGRKSPLRASGVRETDTMVLFWKTPCIFSQWVPTPFVVDNVKYCSAEQYMMASKAALFDDENILAAILKTEDPASHKALGRQVSNFDQTMWDRVKSRFALMGNYQKFRQNPALCEELVATGNKVIAEANPRDFVWGIGMDASDPNVERQECWQGLNLLGKALMKVRKRILLERPELTTIFVDAVISSRVNIADSPGVPAVVNGVTVWF